MGTTNHDLEPKYIDYYYAGMIHLFKGFITISHAFIVKNYQTYFLGLFICNRMNTHLTRSLHHLAPYPWHELENLMEREAKIVTSHDNGQTN